VTCTQCHAGLFTADTTKACQLCPIGTFSSASGAGCQKCASGTADTDSDPTTMCATCVPGRYALSGSAVCRECPSGRADVDRTAATLCLACPAGRFSAPGSIQCSPCPAGEADTDRDPATSCASCKTGSYAAAGSISCDRCPRGTHDDDNNASSICVPTLRASFGTVLVDGALSRRHFTTDMTVSINNAGQQSLGLHPSDISVMIYTQRISGTASFRILKGLKSADFATKTPEGKMVKAFRQGMARMFHVQASDVVVEATWPGTAGHSAWATQGRRNLQQASGFSEWALVYRSICTTDVSGRVLTPQFTAQLALAVNAVLPGSVSVSGSAAQGAAQMMVSRPTVRTDLTYVIAMRSSSDARALDTRIALVLRSPPIGRFGGLKIRGAVGLHAQSNATGQVPPQVKLSKGTVTAKISLAISLSTIPAGSPARASFESAFISDMAGLLNVDKVRILVNGVMSGSVVVDFSIKPAQSGQPIPLMQVKSVFSAPGVQLSATQAITTTSVTNIHVQQTAVSPAPISPPAPAAVVGRAQRTVHAPTGSGVTPVEVSWVALLLMLGMQMLGTCAVNCA
jgi:hypothetical protein